MEDMVLFFENAQPMSRKDGVEPSPKSQSSIRDFVLGDSSMFFRLTGFVGHCLVIQSL